MSENAKAAKQQRLAQALRANLKRRKEAAGRGSDGRGFQQAENGADTAGHARSSTGETGGARNKD